MAEFEVGTPALSSRTFSPHLQIYTPMLTNDDVDLGALHHRRGTCISACCCSPGG